MPSILFIHQGFPAQFKHIVGYLADLDEFDVFAVGLVDRDPNWPSSVRYYKYSISKGNSPDTNPFARDFETKTIRGEACAQLLSGLKASGLNPDLIYGHPGWGECLFIKEIWPNTPLLCYQEFFYNINGFDCNFDPEFSQDSSWQDNSLVRAKMANCLMSLHSSDWNIVPTNFQLSTFPVNFQGKFSVIHDGIDTSSICPGNSISNKGVSDFLGIPFDSPIITFVNRTLEPYRGAHIFIRSIPSLLECNPSAHIVIVGSTDGVSYGSFPIGTSWTDTFMSEIDGQYDRTRVHFLGTVNHAVFLQILQRSNVHVYLTYPFVLSWSLLEAMSAGCAVVASSTSPVLEFIEHSKNGLLFDFFSTQELTNSVCRALESTSFVDSLRLSARESIVSEYSLEVCLSRQLALINHLIS